MTLFIFEGIATSGKSTIIQQLKASLSSLRLTVVDEAETHIPIMKETGNNHINFFTNLVNQKLANDSDLVIFDRLYLTQAFRSKSGIVSYKQVEELILPHNPLTVFLRINNESIADRIYKASKHREAAWEKYIKRKGQSIEQIAEYYSAQQSYQLELLKTSSVPYKIFDTTQHKYQEITKELMALVT